MSPILRVMLGFAAAALSVLTFHQGMLLLMRELGLFGIPAQLQLWSLHPNPRAFGLPVILNLMFWGGLYGALFGLFAPRLPWPAWLGGVATGVLATLVGFFVIAPLRGNPLAGGWQVMAWVRSLLINGSFGLGLGLIFPLLVRAAARPRG